MMLNVYFCSYDSFLGSSLICSIVLMWIDYLYGAYVS